MYLKDVTSLLIMPLVHKQYYNLIMKMLETVHKGEKTSELDLIMNSSSTMRTQLGSSGAIFTPRL